MPVFIILLFLAVGLLWLLLSFAFVPLGKFVGRMIKDAKDAISEEDPSENKNNKEIITK